MLDEFGRIRDQFGTNSGTDGTDANSGNSGTDGTYPGFRGDSDRVGALIPKTVLDSPRLAANNYQTHIAGVRSVVRSGDGEIPVAKSRIL